MNKKTYKGFSYFRSLIFLALIIFVIVFQGQQSGSVFDDNNPYIEQPTMESYMNYRNNNQTHTPSIITVDGYDNFDIGVDNWEQNMTINPLNPLEIFFGANANPQNARYSTNGGLNWTVSNPSYHSSTCCDPWSSYTGNGVLIYASGVNGQYVYRSTNNGMNWSTPVLSVAGNDRNHVSAEYTGNGPYANYVYAGITPGNFGRSTDAGATWTTTFTPSNSLPGCYIAVGPNGAVDGGCVIYVTNTGSVNARTYNFYRSTDGGATFTLRSSQNYAAVVGTANTAGRHVINNARTNPHPKIAMDNSNGPYRGRLYLVYANNNPPASGNKPDIFLRYSTDQGATWSDTNRVNDNINPMLSDQWFPEIYCEKDNGRLYIHWYDDRNNPVNYGTDIYATYTEDGGQTFEENQRLTNTTFLYPRPVCAVNSNCYRGDYTSIAGNKDAAYSVWGDHRNGNAQNMGGYFPDFALTVSPESDTLRGIADSSFHNVKIPGVKLWDKSTVFSAIINPVPASGSISMTFLNNSTNIPKDSLTSYPDSLRLRVVTSGAVPTGVYTVMLKGNGRNATPVHVRNISITVDNPVGIISNQTAVSFDLYQNFPNPFNPSTSIIYELPQSELVTLKIFDALGKEVTNLVNSRQSAGVYSVDWNAGNHPSGIYFYTIQAGNFKETKRMMLLK